MDDNKPALHDELSTMISDLSHTGDLSMLYRIGIADTITALRAELRKVTAERDGYKCPLGMDQSQEPNLCSAGVCVDCIARQAKFQQARAEAAEHQLKTVLDREAATTARYDAKMETAEAEVARLKAQAREDAMQLLATSGQAQDALAEVATLRAELDDAKSENASRSAMFATVSAELDAARGRVKPMRFEQCASGMWSSGLVLGGEYRIKLVGGKGYQISRGMLCVPDCTVWHETLDLAIAAAQADYTARILATLEPDPAVARMREPDSDWGDFIWSALNEAEKAMRKFPQPNYVISKIAEEAGEVVKAAIHCAEGRETTENVRGEMKQLVAMLYRLWVEGDQVHGMLAARTSGTGVGE